MKNAILLISHGSRAPLAKKEVIQLSKRLKKKSRIPIFVYCFLEINHPNIPAGIERCVKKGATKIFVLMNFLNSGRHALDDIPRLIQKSKRKYPHLEFVTTPPMGQHPEIENLFLSYLPRSPKK